MLLAAVVSLGIGITGQLLQRLSLIHILLAEKAILICAAVLFMAFIMMFVDKEKALEQ